MRKWKTCLVLAEGSAKFGKTKRGVHCGRSHDDDSAQTSTIGLSSGISLHRAIAAARKLMVSHTRRNHENKASDVVARRTRRSHRCASVGRCQKHRGGRSRGRAWLFVCRVW